MPVRSDGASVHATMPRSWNRISNAQKNIGGRIQMRACFHRFVHAARVCAFALLSTFVLAACGGGGGEDPQAPPGLTFSATPANLAAGGTITLSWSSANAASCSASGGWSGAKAVSGSEIVAAGAAGTVTFTLDCSGAGGGVSRSATVVINATPPTLTLSSDVAATKSGRTFTLTWTAANATSCTASGAWAGNKALSGSEVVTAAAVGVATYTLACVGAAGAISKDVTVVITVPPAPTLAITSDPTTINVGSSNTYRIIWSTTDAVSCTASGAWSGTRGTAGGETFIASSVGSRTYTLTCNGPGGSVKENATVTITSPPSPLPQITLASSQMVLSPGDVFTITWSTTNATSCTGAGSWGSGSKPTSGSEAFTAGPTGTNYGFALNCTGPAGISSQSLSLTVSTTASDNIVAGRLLVSGNTQTDSDTNEPRQTLVANNTLPTAQPLPTTVVLGGYVNKAGQGPEGPSKANGDPFDYFNITLTAGQVIELGFTSSRDNDLDLALYLPDGTLVDESSGIDSAERLTVATAGSYRILVEAFSGASNYILTVSQQGPASASSAVTLSTEFTPGELLLGVQQPTGTALRAQAFAADAVGSAHGLAIGYHSPAGYSLLKLDAPRVQIQSAGAALAGRLPGTRYRNASDRLKSQTLRELKQLRRDPQVAWVDVNRIMHASAVPNDPYYAYQRWHYEQISLPDAWNVTKGSSGVIVAVVDTGVRPHAELASRLVYPYDFATVSPGDGDGDDSDANDPGEAVGNGLSFHGTHVAGTIGAAGNNGAGVTGVAWNVRIMPVRALGTYGAGSSTDVIEAIRYAAGLSNRSGTVPAQRADIINLSLGATGSCPTAYSNVISAVRAAGVMVVAAAGNAANGANVPVADAPANCPGVIGVAAVNRNRTRASYSNAGAGVDVAAPGGESADQVFSTWANLNNGIYTDGFIGISGTSMASPHVAGVLALMKGVNPLLTPDQIDNLLASGALSDDIGPAGADDLGIGLINAFKAVMVASNGATPIPGQLGLSPTSLNFGDVASSADITLRNSGSEPVQVTARTSSVPWLTIQQVQVDGNGFGIYRIFVNRGALADGSYSAYVEFAGSTGSPVRVTVLVEKRSDSLQPSAGMHYVILYDAATRATRKIIQVNATGAETNFQLVGVAPGNYGLVAGTDLDHDMFICDANEACAAYPVFGDPRPLQVTVATPTVDLSTTYRASYGNTSSSLDATSAGREPGPSLHMLSR